MNKKILSNFIWFLMICSFTLAISAQIKIPSVLSPGMREIPREGDSWNPYSGFEYEKERLNLLAKVWKYNSNQDIYLYIYGAEKDEELIADEFGEKAGKYLADSHNIPKNKITIIIFHQSFSVMQMRMYLFNPDDEDLSWFERLSIIKVGVSTKQDFEKTFTILDIKSDDKLNKKNEIRYRTYDGDAFVVYSNEKCSSLPKDTIISITFEPYLDYLTLSDLKLDVSQFKTKKDVNSKNRIYANEKLGITFSISDDTKLISTSFDLSKDQKQNLKCSNLPQP